jgi:hypothetical protein
MDVVDMEDMKDDFVSVVETLMHEEEEEEEENWVFPEGVFQEDVATNMDEA